MGRCGRCTRWKDRAVSGVFPVLLPYTPSRGRRGAPPGMPIERYIQENRAVPMISQMMPNRRNVWLDARLMYQSRALS